MSSDLGNRWKGPTHALGEDDAASLDLDLPDDLHDLPWDDSDPFDLNDYAPDSDDGGGPLDDLDILGLPLRGDGAANARWSDESGVDVTWPWG